ncbi:hypothetical protein DL89DRAFT_168033 [Linderina pennispora]|uniref:Uncharacterized protein n=1 Tax=Linderina pennispora TaxID=61395 RepID=A0A1Y1VTU8_9FUNG|nr:uncharacterized protein DL89DRAFT_168033 [Linderina pennispora]ORX64613.1 hypothetical protein DL89DRAFT_168033 [Linderina pennispora]
MWALFRCVRVCAQTPDEPSWKKPVLQAPIDGSEDRLCWAPRAPRVRRRQSDACLPRKLYLQPFSCVAEDIRDISGRWHIHSFRCERIQIRMLA